MENRLLELRNMLASYSIGNFDYEVELSPQLDEIDAIISGVNMLGKELNNTTVSRDFFSSIYNAVSNVLFVTDLNGIITDVNKTVNEKLGYTSEEVIGKSLSIIFPGDNKWDLDLICEKLKNTDQGISFEAELLTKNGKLLCNSCSWSKIINRAKKFKGYLLIAEDITDKKETEKLLIHTILDTQEKERKRVANDLHDSLGQELFTTKMMLDIAIKKLDSKETTDAANIINSCIDILDSSILGVRSICFDLMPNVLQVDSIINALQELIMKLPIKVQLSYNNEDMQLPKEQELMLYRVCQEFINNTMKYAEATLIEININEESNVLSIQLSDNGKGFKVGETERVGRGSNTMKTRIESFGGKYELKSELGKGTKMSIVFKK